MAYGIRCTYVHVPRMRRKHVQTCEQRLLVRRESEHLRRCQESIEQREQSLQARRESEHLRRRQESVEQHRQRLQARRESRKSANEPQTPRPKTTGQA